MLRCGVDLIEVARLRAAIEEHGEHFLRRVFTPAEISYCAPKHDPYPHYAARFAAKEALYKALPPDTLPALVWREIGVVHDAAGAPQLDLTGETRTRLAGWQFALSLSHGKSLAIAQVLAQPPAPPE